jgi:hypothetical protein
MCKIKVDLFVVLIKHHATKMYGVVEAWFHSFLISALGGGEWSVSRPGRFTPGVHWIGGCVGPRADMDAAKNILPLLEIEPRPSSLY